MKYFRYHSRPKTLLTGLSGLLFLSLMAMSPGGAQPASDAPVSQGSLLPGGSPAAPMPVSCERGDYFNLQDKKLARFSDAKKYVLVYIAPGNGLPGWTPDLNQRVITAFKEWETVLNFNGVKHVQFLFVRDPATTDVVVNWVFSAKSLGAVTEELGNNETMLWDKYIEKDDIHLSLTHSDSEHPFTEDEIQTAALHEIGHMLGIKTHSNNPLDIMYPVAQPDVHHLSCSDIMTMRRIYSTPPYYTNPPGYALSHFEEFKKTVPNKGFWIPILLP